MPRWDPDAQTRLVAAATELFGQHGYDAVTVTEITERAGLTRRSFFRYFPDKREVLFAGSEQNIALVSERVRSFDDDVSPREAVVRTLVDVGAFLLRDPAAQARRQALIDASAELGERERTKLAAMATALGDGAVERGLSREDARILGSIAVEVFHDAYLRALAGAAGPFEDGLRRSLGTVTRLLTE